MATTIKLKRKESSSTWNGVLNEGEPLFDIKSNELYIGDGERTLQQLPPLCVGKTSIVSNDVYTTITSNAGGIVRSLTITGGMCAINASNIIQSQLFGVYLEDVESPDEKLTIEGYNSNASITVNNGVNFSIDNDISNDSLIIKGTDSDVVYADLTIKDTNSLNNTDIKNSTLDNFDGKDVDLISYDNEIHLISTGQFTQAALVITGSVDIDEAIIYGNGHSLELKGNATLHSNNIVYANIYDTLSINSSTQKLTRSGGATTFGINLTDFYITQVALSGAGGRYSGVYTYHSESSNTVVLYMDASNYISITSNGSLIEIAVYGTAWTGVSNITMTISYRAR